jgi:type I restriction enzyme S subunit
MAREAPVGNVAMVPPGLELCLGQRTLLIRPDLARVYPKYLTYLLIGPDVQAEIHAKTNGVTVPHLNMGDVRELELPPLPALAVQKKIADAISAYDDLAANCEQRIHLLDEMARSLYREWFVLFHYPGHEKVPLVHSPAGKIPQDWQSGRLDDVLVLQRGFDLPKVERRDGPVPIIAATGVGGFHDTVKVRAPGVVTGRSGSIGSVLYIQEDFWPLNTTLWVKAFPNSEPLYAYYVLSSIDLGKFNGGAAVPTLNRNALHGLPAVVPPRPLQARFQSVAGAMHGMMHVAHRQANALRRARDLLLPRLLSGQVDVKGVG